MKTNTPEAGFDEVLIRRALSAVAALGMCLTAGGIVYALPDWIYSYVMSQSQDPEGVWRLAENYAAAAFTGATILFAVLIPVCSKLTGRFVILLHTAYFLLVSSYNIVFSYSPWLGAGQSWNVTLPVILFMWSAFLGCLAPLNISASYLMLALVGPVLLVLTATKRR